MSDADPVFAAIERYEAACRVFDAAGGIGRDVIVATAIALRARPRLKKVMLPNESISPCRRGPWILRLVLRKFTLFARCLLSETSCRAPGSRRPQSHIAGAYKSD
jgi:hypothetical protein